MVPHGEPLEEEDLEIGPLDLYLLELAGWHVVDGVLHARPHGPEVGRVLGFEHRLQLFKVDSLFGNVMRPGCQR